MLSKRFGPVPLRNPSTRPRSNPPAGRSLPARSRPLPATSSPTAPAKVGPSAGVGSVPQLQRITQAELELFLLAQRRASEAKRHLEAIEQRILSRFVAGARVEPGVHAPKLGLIVE